MTLLAGLVGNDEKKGFFLKKKKNVPNSRLECNNHTKFETEMTKMSENPIPFEAAHTYITDVRENPLPLSRGKGKCRKSIHFEVC